jgi:hypothetical protein
MLSAATPILTGVLDHNREEPYRAAMATGTTDRSSSSPITPTSWNGSACIPHSYGKPRTLPNSSRVRRNLRKLLWFVQGRAGPGSPVCKASERTEMAVIVQRCEGGDLSVQSLQFSKSKWKFWINEQYSKSNAKRSLNISPYQNHDCLGEPVLPNRL